MLTLFSLSFAGSSDLVVVFSSSHVAVKFAMAAQVGLLLNPSTAKLKLAVSICEGKSKGKDSQDFQEISSELESGRNWSNTSTLKSSLAASRQSGIQGTVGWSLVRSVVVQTGERSVGPGQSVVNHPAWSQAYNATAW